MSKEALLINLDGITKEARLQKILKSSLTGGTTKQVMKGFERASSESGPTSFIGAIPGYIAGMVVGRDKVKKAVWNKVSKPALIADTVVGHYLRKIPGAKNLFTEKTTVPWGKEHSGLRKEVTRASALAPLGKARDFAAPILVATGAERGIHALKEMGSDMKKQQQNDMMKTSDAKKHPDEQHLREKVASTMLRLHEANKEHEKRAQAAKLIYKQAELGMAALPQTYGEFETKIASLVSQDMAVLEKALELTAGNLDLGELSGGDPTQSAASTFQSDVLGF